jgi:hypothetical protein
MYVLEFATWPGLIGALCDELDGLQLAYMVEGNTATVDAYDPWRLSDKLRCAQNAFVRLSYDVPRPKALLGQQYWDEIVAMARDIVGRGAFATLNLDAAGADSSVMQRIVTTLGTTLGLTAVTDDADLQMRIRQRSGYWEVLFRRGHVPGVSATTPAHSMQWSLQRWCDLVGCTPRIGLSTLPVVQGPF